MHLKLFYNAQYWYLKYNSGELFNLKNGSVFWCKTKDWTDFCRVWTWQKMYAEICEFLWVFILYDVINALIIKIIINELY